MTFEGEDIKTSNYKDFRGKLIRNSYNDFQATVKTKIKWRQRRQKNIR